MAAIAVGVTGGQTEAADPASAATSSTAPPPLVTPDSDPTFEDTHRLASRHRRATAASDHRTRLRKQAEARAAERERKARVARAEKRARLAAMDPRDLARAMIGRYGWGASQFRCLDSLWTRESGWDRHAQNPSSGAYGIPQALPGSKMGSVAEDWRTNPVTQIRWGLGYIRASYGSPCGAWSHSQSHGWY